ncbi:hypothetical protein GCM10009682_45960 [Luedemannella flava]|uniref:Uncharacterized protein n=1 Tax=Luedemannella flava TaxID=349316 RepID=A0ABN2MCF1_9ACTN
MPGWAYLGAVPAGRPRRALLRLAAVRSRAALVWPDLTQLALAATPVRPPRRRRRDAQAAPPPPPPLSYDPGPPVATGLIIPPESPSGYANSPRPQ